MMVKNFSEVTQVIRDVYSFFLQNKLLQPQVELLIAAFTPKGISVYTELGVVKSVAAANTPEEDSHWGMFSSVSAGIQFLLL